MSTDLKRRTLADRDLDQLERTNIFVQSFFLITASAVLAIPLLMGTTLAFLVIAPILLLIIGLLRSLIPHLGDDAIKALNALGPLIADNKNTIALLAYLVLFLLALFLCTICVRSVDKARITAGREWMRWRDGGQIVSVADDLPSLSEESELATCVASYLPTSSHSDQYNFHDPGEGAMFCSTHQRLLVGRIRRAFVSLPPQRALTIGWLEWKDHRSLLFYRQIQDDCAAFLLVRHRLTGSVANVISQRWVLCNRVASPASGRSISDADSARKAYGQLDSERRKSFPPERAEWGILGEWYWVNKHQCNETPDTVEADSELDYLEKMVHIETVKEAMLAVRGAADDRPESPRIADTAESPPEFL
jgi:hypothetical protein